MKNCIIIKFYRNENLYTSDYHDLMIDVYPKLVDELATFLQSKVDCSNWVLGADK